MEQIHIKPNTDAEGKPLRVRLDNPTEILPADGAVVPLTPHIIRRINDGSVLVVEQTRIQPRKPKE
jgi:hypothetical protein